MKDLLVEVKGRLPINHPDKFNDFLIRELKADINNHIQAAEVQDKLIPSEDRYITAEDFNRSINLAKDKFLVDYDELLKEFSEAVRHSVIGKVNKTFEETASVESPSSYINKIECNLQYNKECLDKAIMKTGSEDIKHLESFLRKVSLDEVEDAIDRNLSILRNQLSKLIFNTYFKIGIMRNEVVNMLNNDHLLKSFEKDNALAEITPTQIKKLAFNHSNLDINVKVIKANE